MSTRRSSHTLPELLTKHWLKYDKNITSVLRTMGFNSMQAFNKSNALKSHYFMIFNELKTDPNKGLLELHNAIEELRNSTRYKALLWIERNAAKYHAFKHGNKKVEQIALEVEEYINKLKQFPGILNVKTNFVSILDSEKGRMDNATENQITLDIWYDPSLTVTKKTKYTNETFRLNYSQPILQRIKGSISEDLVHLNLDTASVTDVLRKLFTPNTLRSSFKFAGPCIYIPKSNQSYNYHGQSLSKVGSGCLGNMQEDYNEVVNEGTIENYLMFITQWFTLYNEESHPYSRPRELLSNNNKLLGFPTKEAARYVLKQTSDVIDTRKNVLNKYCLISDYKTEADRNNVSSYQVQNMIDQTVLRYTNQAPDVICNTCALDECTYNPKAKKPEVSSSVHVVAKEKLTDATVEQLLMLHRRLIHEDYSDSPIKTQIVLLKESKDYMKSTDQPDFDNVIYQQYIDIIKKSEIDWNLIINKWNEKYGKS